MINFDARWISTCITRARISEMKLLFWYFVSFILHSDVILHSNTFQNPNTRIDIAMKEKYLDLAIRNGLIQNFFQNPHIQIYLKNCHDSCCR